MVRIPRPRIAYTVLLMLTRQIVIYVDNYTSVKCQCSHPVFAQQRPSRPRPRQHVIHTIHASKVIGTVDGTESKVVG